MVGSRSRVTLAVPQRTWLAYAAALLLTVAALTARIQLVDWFGPNPALILFLVPIIVGAYLGGIGPGLLATAIAAIGTKLLLIPPLHTLYISGSVDVLRWSIMVVNGVLVSVMSEALHRARRRSDAMLAERQRAGEVQAQLAAIVDASDAAIVGTTTEGVVTSWNSGAEKIFGYSAAEAIGQSIQSLVFPSERATEETELLLRAVRGETVQVEAGRKRKDGTLVNVSITISPIRDGIGSVIGLARVARDVTERTRAHEALRASEARFRDLLVCAGEGIYGLDLEGCVTFINPAGARMLGFEIDELLGKNMHQLVHHTRTDGSPFPNAECPVYSVFNDGLMRRVDDEVFWRKDGTSFPVEYVSTPVRDERTGKTRGAVVTFRDLTQQKQAELALSASDRRLETVIEHLAEGLVISDTDGNMLHWNRAALEFYALRGPEEPVRRLQDFRQILEVSPIDGPAIEFEQWPMQRILHGETLRNVELRLRRTDIQWERIGSYSGALVHDASGRSLAFLSFTDITERKHAEEKLRFQETVLQETGRIAKVGGWTFDAVTGAGYWTEEVARIHDLDPADPISRELGLTYYHGASRTRIEAAVDAAVAHAIPYDLELELTTATGAHKWVRTIGNPIVQNGKVIRVHGSFQDITDRRRVEDSLKLFRTLVDRSNDAFEVIDPESGRFLDVNERGCADIGYGRDELLALRVFDIDIALDPAAWPQWVDTLRSETTRTLQASHRRKDGSTFPVEVNFRWVQLDRSYIVSVVRDISERQRAEESQLRARKMEALGTLAGGIAHDFNNILVAIRGNVEMAADDLPVSHPALEHLSEIEKASARAADLVRRILAFSRQQEPKRELLMLRPVVEEALMLLRASLPAMLTLDSKIAADLPPIAADATQIHQIIMNLATNSAHAIGARTGTIELQLDAVTIGADLVRMVPGLNPGRYVRLTMNDNGCGMDSATLARIFDPFFTTKPVGTGTGLGLSVVEGIMKNHGGAVGVYSEPGSGTSFRLYFPAASGAVSSAIERPRQVATARGEHVLYVDDEAPLVRIASRKLARLGYRVTGCTDPASALVQFRTQPQDFDVVVSDVSMPRMSGLELVREVLAIRPDIPILLTSGYFRPEDQEAAARLGVRALIQKPDSIEDLGPALDRLFDKNKSE